MNRRSRLIYYGGGGGGGGGGGEVAKSCVKSCRKPTKYIYIAYRYKFADMRVALCAIFAFLPGIKFNKAFIARVEEGRRGKATMDKVYEACITSKSITPSSLLHYY